MPALPSAIPVVIPNKTCKSILMRAMRIQGVLPQGEEPEAAALEVYLEALNDMVDSWNLEKLFTVIARNTYTLTAGQASYTIGAGGDFDAARPTKIERAGYVVSGSPDSEHPLDVYTADEWAGVVAKDASGTPCGVWSDNGVPLTTLYVSPVPSVGDSLALYTWSQLSQVAFADINQTLDLGAGVRDALCFGLAVRMAAEDGQTLKDEVVSIATLAKANVKRRNMEPIKAMCDSALLSGGIANIYSGDF